MRHTILHADVMDGLRAFPDRSVHCIITSPPYWGLRDYGIEGQIGIEPSPEEYVQKIVAVFREARRVLRDDGTMWLNLGDCYARSRSAWGLKAKDLVGMPWRIAFALQADGWYLRSDIIWSKPNAMPESVRDRPTKSHEYVFLLTKSSRYYYDADAIREEHESLKDLQRRKTLDNKGDYGGVRKDLGRSRAEYYNPAGRNRRDVWRIATQATPEAHFATFPEKLVDPCIRAGTSERGACPECGAPWVRVIDRVKARRTERSDNPNARGLKRCPSEIDSVHTVGWQPSCTCDVAETVPCVVLDPFVGSGTVSLVAHGLGRSSVGIELGEKYIDIIKSRWVRGGRPAEALEVRTI